MVTAEPAQFDRLRGWILVAGVERTRTGAEPPLRNSGLSPDREGRPSSRQQNQRRLFPSARRLHQSAQRHASSANKTGRRRLLGTCRDHPTGSDEIGEAERNRGSSTNVLRFTATKRRVTEWAAGKKHGARPGGNSGHRRPQHHLLDTNLSTDATKKGTARKVQDSCLLGDWPRREGESVAILSLPDLRAH